MALPTTYGVGTITVETGSTAVAGDGTAWSGKVFAGDFLFLASQPLVPAVRVAADATDDAMVLAWPWPGTDEADVAYEVHITPDATRVQERTRRVLALLGSIANTGLGVDAIGEFADRVSFDGSAAGFAFLSTDGDGDTITDPVVFIKATATSADWSNPIEFRGPVGPQGVPGIIGVWKGAYSGVAAYDAGGVTRNAGSAWIAKVPTTGNAPPSLPTTSNTWWELVSQKGDPGDVAGPGSSVAGHVARFADTSGALLEDGGALGTAAYVDTGTTSGKVPLLDGSGKLDTSILPAIAVTDVFTVANEAAMLALTAEKGDIAIRADLNKSFALSTNSPTTLADWKELLTPTDVVLAVAGLTGSISASALKAALAIAAGDVSGILAQGKVAVYLPASAMVARATSGAGSSTYDSGSNDLTLLTGDFDTTAQEYLQVECAMPKSWDRGTATARMYWTATGGSSTQTVRWTIAGVAASDGDSLNVAAGTAVYVDDTWQANNSLHVTAETPAMTIAGSPAAEDLVVLQISRDVANDNMAGDARLIGVVLYINLNAATDA